MLDNIKYWLFAKQSKKQCAIDLVPVLYFYSEEHCPNCGDQGVLLTYYKKLYGERLLIFPINSDLEQDESMITVLKSRYNVTQYPTIIVGEEKFQGVTDKTVLGKMICDNFVNKDNCYEE